MDDERQKLYSAPSLSTIAAYFCTALMIFFVTLFVLHYNATKREFARLDKRIESLEQQGVALRRAPAAMPETDRAAPPRGPP